MMHPRLNKAILIALLLTSTAALAEEPFRFKRAADTIDMPVTPVYEITPQNPDALTQPQISAPVPTSPPNPMTVAPPVVQMRSLASSSEAMGFGLIDEQGGGFSVDVWQGIKADLIFDLTSAISAPPAPSIRDLVVKLMKTQAYAPKEISKVEPFITLRSETLLKMGAVSDTAAFLKNYSGTVGSDALLKNYTQTFFAELKVDEGCIAADSGLKQFSSVFWDRAKILCDILKDNKDSATLSLKLLQEKGTISSTFDRMAASALSGETFKWTSDDMLGVLETVLAGKLNLLGKLPATDKGEIKYDNLGLYTVLNSPSAGDEAKINAGEKLAKINYINPDKLQQLYMAVSFTDDQLNAIISGGEAKDDAYGHAGLFQSALKAQTPAQKIMLWKKFLTSMKKADLTLSAYHMGAGIFLSAAPSVDYLPAIRDIVLSFLMTGQEAAVTPWVDFIKTNPAAEPGLVDQAMIDVWPLIEIQKSSNKDKAFDTDVIQWRDMMSHDRRDGAKEMYYTYAVLLDAVGYIVPPVVWDDFAGLKKSGEVDFNLLNQLEKSTGRKGLAILWLATAAPKMTTSIDVAAAMVKALKQNGFHKEASQLAYLALSAR